MPIIPGITLADLQEHALIMYYYKDPNEMKCFSAKNRWSFKSIVPFGTPEYKFRHVY